MFLFVFNTKSLNTFFIISCLLKKYCESCTFMDIMTHSVIFCDKV